MVRSGFERVLLIGDTDRQVYAALAQGSPGAQITSVPTVFDGTLLIGAPDRQVYAALARGGPGAQIPGGPAVFEGIGELPATASSPVLVAAEPIERRPEAAVRTLRELSAGGRLVLFGHPTL